jgi:hypothetical protein
VDSRARGLGDGRWQPGAAGVMVEVEVALGDVWRRADIGTVAAA